MAHASVHEREIVQALQRVPPDRWGEVLAFIVSLESLQEQPSSALAGLLPQKKWTAAELRRLPAEQRDAILAEQAALLDEEYRSNPELTAFDTFFK